VTKRELVIQVAEELGLPQNEVARIVQTALDNVSEALVSGNRLEIRNFGVFEVKTRGSRRGRNPRTGDEVPIAEKRVVTFKAGKSLKERVMAPGEKSPKPTVEDPSVPPASPVSPFSPTDGPASE
jgi:nucleoid DNA-binding protein